MYGPEPLKSIEVGVTRQMLLLESDTFEANPYEIHKIPIMMTVMGGKETYSRK
ncbi:MAG TPA: hypothetical protein VFC96_00550 [Anaerovoracaceae bacterium]|nr:hypothetical protein [Anaerovoracaceae bacterium]